MTDIATGSAVYVDSNLIIYFVEKVPVFFEKANTAFGKLAEREVRVFTSELTIAECIYLPSRGGHHQLIAAYEAFFNTAGNVRLIALNGEIAKRAALKGGSWGLKLLDAIHFESAIDAECTVFLTADLGFKSIDQLQVLHV